MALYWHPFLADLLRHRYADRLLIYELRTRQSVTLWLAASQFAAWFNPGACQVARLWRGHL